MLITLLSLAVLTTTTVLSVEGDSATYQLSSPKGHNGKKLWYAQPKQVYEEEELQQEYERGYRKGFREGYNAGYKRGKRTALINNAWRGFTVSLTACCIGCIFYGVLTSFMQSE